MQCCAEMAAGNQLFPRLGVRVTQDKAVGSAIVSFAV